eukprot:scaffold7052_cov254-Pinguiococcus_pyrenoidosus.AAC.34
MEGSDEFPSEEMSSYVSATGGGAAGQNDWRDKFFSDARSKNMSGLSYGTAGAADEDVAGSASLSCLVCGPSGSFAVSPGDLKSRTCHRVYPFGRCGLPAQSASRARRSPNFEQSPWALLVARLAIAPCMGRRRSPAPSCPWGHQFNEYASATGLGLAGNGPVGAISPVDSSSCLK